MITLENIQFSYTKGFPALSGISAQLEPGILLLAGENGAGKTTLLRIMAGALAPTKGYCSINGNDPASDIPSQRGKTFLVEDNMELPGKNIREFAHIHSRFYPNFSPELFVDNLKAFGLSGYEPMKSLSYGNRKKTQIAYALALGVDLLLLDEPTNGLDIQSKTVLRSIIANSATENQTIIIATHTVSDLENLYDGAIMISGARLLFSAFEDEVARRLSFSITSSPDPDSFYSETSLGKYLNVSPADGDETRVDWRLLYSALHSPKREEIISILNSNPSIDND
ncbi:MAG: ATP-binding cassette domain-containing protein [Muribaculaceae bacterium]|nr:ATP-binding cassette domain-containing protein [Muribaculaceae bacterium]MDE6753467.1 ATP-binding cassette domain-containing protein [Muribaculaceae bacterium]